MLIFQFPACVLLKGNTTGWVIPESGIEGEGLLVPSDLPGVMGDSDSPVYYVISDLHIGGDEQIGEIPFRDELLEFLERLIHLEEDVELIINGDSFGLWEYTGIEGPEKLDLLIESYPKVFEQLKRTGEAVEITLIPGNHDHEMAAYEEYVDRLAAYNIRLVQDESITKPIADRYIYFEHGHQRDSNNRFEDFGNPHEKPLGYHYNVRVISRAGHLSDRGRVNWLKDIQAVTPTQRIGSWVLSKYFYREMHPWLRYAALPFLFLFNISLLMVLLAGLDLLDVWSFPVTATVEFLGQLGAAGTAMYWLLTVNIAIAGLLVLIGIPGYFLLLDFRRTIERFGIFETPLTVNPNEPYEQAARDTFVANPEVAVFCYGHTHRPAIRQVDGGVLANSGTWLKRLHRRNVIAGLLPPVYYPSYQLGAIRIEEGPEGITVSFEAIDKPSPKGEELTLTERVLTLGREPKPDPPESITIPHGED